MTDIYEQTGVFCEVFGETLRNRMLEYILTSDQVDFAAPDMVEDLKISPPTVYIFLEEMLKKGILKKTRVVGKTQLYLLDKTSPITKVLKTSFNACLKMVVDEYEEEGTKPLQKQIAVAEKRIPYKKAEKIAKKSKLTKKDVDEFDKKVKKLAHRRFNA